MLNGLFVLLEPNISDNLPNVSTVFQMIANEVTVLLDKACESALFFSPRFLQFNSIKAHQISFLQKTGLKKLYPKRPGELKYELTFCLLIPSLNRL
jgi:hypothetical protein